MATHRASMALRGLAVTVVLVVGAGLLVAKSAGAFRGSTTITCLLPAAAGPVDPATPVRYQGVEIGTVADVRADTDGARITVETSDGVLERVPSAVRASVLPRTVFGDRYIDLAAPSGADDHGNLHSGAVVRANTATRTVRLYTAYNRLYELISAMHPAEIQVALDTLSDALRGKGSEVGRMIDKAARLGSEVEPELDGFGADVRTVAELSDDLADAAPDMLAALQDTVAMSETVVEERDSIRSLLSSGTELSDEAQRSLRTNGQRVIELVHTTDEISDVFARHPHVIEESLDATGRFLDNAINAFSTGHFKIEAAASLDDPHPYTAADCPHYPGESGPNCEKSARNDNGSARESSNDQAGGTAGPVGSRAERRKLAELGDGLVDDGKSRDSDDESSQPDTDLLGVLLGPVVRGKRVTVP